MDRREILLQLAQKISTASATDDWQALAAADCMMASSLPAMATQGQWTSSEHAALVKLRNIHSAAYNHCTQVAVRLDEHLSGIQANKEGWIAYALNSEADPDGTQA